MKRIAALILCTIMVLTCLSSCTNKTQVDESDLPDSTDSIEQADSEITKIVWGVKGGTWREDTSYVNELLKKKGYPYEIEIKAITDESYISGIEAAKNAGEQVDILNGFGFSSDDSGYTFDLFDIIKGGYCITLDDYLSSDAGNDIRQIYPEKTLDAAKINGKLYHIPNPFLPPFTYIFYWDKELAGKYDLDMTKVQNDISLIEEYAKTVYDGEKGRNAFYVSTAGNNSFWNIRNEKLMGFQYLVVDCSVQPPRGRFFYDNESFLQMNEMLERMYNYGCIANTETVDYTKPFDTFFGITTALSEDEFQEVYNADGKYEYFIYDKETLTYQYAYTGNVITSWCQQPDKAFDFLSIVMTDPDINNALTYGELDKDYKVIDGRVYAADGMSMSQVGHSFYNCFTSLPLDNRTNSKEKLYDAYEELEVSPICGFLFDTENVQNEIDALARIYFNEVDDKASTGYISNLEGIKRQMNDAGIQKVLDELNRQLEEWWNNNKPVDAAQPD